MRDLEKEVGGEKKNTRLFYELLGVEEGCSEKDVKKGFMRCALLYHPDKAGDSDSAKRNFQVVLKIYNVLCDVTLREEYDRTGNTNLTDYDEDADAAEEDLGEWYKVFRTMFSKVTSKDIDDYEKKYVNSVEERNDIIEWYRKSHGDIHVMMDNILFVDEDDPNDLKRICTIIDELIGENVLQSEKLYENRKKKKRRRNESKEAEELANELGLNGNLQSLILNNRQKREQNFNNLISSLEKRYKK